MIFYIVGPLFNWYVRIWKPQKRYWYYCFLLQCKAVVTICEESDSLLTIPHHALGILDQRKSSPQTYVPHCPGTASNVIRLLGFANMLWESFVATFREKVSEHICYTRYGITLLSLWSPGLKWHSCSVFLLCCALEIMM